MIDKELLDILACPVCGADLNDNEQFLACCQCLRRYPIKEGIPILLEDEAVLPDVKDR